MKRIESRKSLLAKVHIAKKDLGLDNDTYRSVLERTTGQRSAGDCAYQELVRVVAEFRRLGWSPDKKPAPPKGKAALRGKITALLAEANRPDAYAEAMVLRMYKRDKLAFCTPKELQGIIAALSKDAKRHGRTA
ncbi:MAG: regulatory protein GemA [Desulfovibrio sp.]|nr:regulatory protein GemA [Desulfovibrio sp.]MBI4960398.1 regulatory protein GemA [Desulfovibrio sp.]